MSEIVEIAKIVSLTVFLVLLQPTRWRVRCSDSLSSEKRPSGLLH